MVELKRIFENGESILCLDFEGLSTYVDFVSGVLGFRRKFRSSQKQPLAKAVGVSQKSHLSVVDATAGFGSDAFILASLGCKVMALESNHFVYQVLEDGYLRGLKHPEVARILENLKIMQGNAIDYLSKLGSKDQPDVVYLDPMFFDKAKKSAKSPKEMQILQHLLGEPSREDLQSLFDQAKAAAKSRVVVKRPRLSKPLTPAPSFTLPGKSIHFDVYLTNLA